MPPGNPIRYGTKAVQCLVCMEQMVVERPVARAMHTSVGDTLYVKWVCHTIDCGTEVVIEDDYDAI